MTTPDVEQRTVALVTLGCTRNEVDSEELAGRLRAGGWRLVDDAADADVAVVNTCGFVEQAKKDSIDTLLEAADLKETGRTQAVVAVGCLAERYGQTLADELPDADAVLGFDSYADLSGQLRRILAGEKVASHVPSDRRRLLPISPVDRPSGAEGVALPGHESGAEQVMRARLDDRPWAPLKIASGCDRRCSFCAIPSFRGSFVSRRPTDVLAEAQWLGEQGVKELFLVSENSTSYGKDLGDLALLEAILPELCALPGIERVRVSYLQPAEIRPGLIEAMAALPTVMPWYDLSFQHSSEQVLRRMRRFGNTDNFLALIDRIRRLEPEAGIRTNVIVGFPGETEADVDELERFLVAADLDVVGVFAYSDEDGTEAEHLPDKIDEDVIAQRHARITDLVEELTAQRAAARVGEDVLVLVDEIDEDTGEVVGRAAHQGPEVDGVTILPPGSGEVGELVAARVSASEGVDLRAERT
jgi:ribosomal protein S12 methylthiotransferase RimO